jgi:hypothetical protein
MTRSFGAKQLGSEGVRLGPELGGGGGAQLEDGAVPESVAPLSAMSDASLAVAAI